MYMFSKKFFILFLFNVAWFPSQTLQSHFLKSNPYFPKPNPIHASQPSQSRLPFSLQLTAPCNQMKLSFAILRSLCSRVAQLQTNNVWDKFVPRAKTGIACTLPCNILPTMETTEDVLVSSDLQEAARVLGVLNKLGRLMQKKLFFACLAKHKGLWLRLLLAERSDFVQNC